MMKRLKQISFFVLLFVLITVKNGHGQSPLSITGSDASKPWVFWYWMNASVSKEGITADLQAMKELGIGGAYLMPIKGPTAPPLMDPPITQLTPAWWEMIAYAMNEADRLKLKLGIHASDGFALAGGPWITPELSMQKVVWTQTHIKGGDVFNEILTQPEDYKGYYNDIAVLAFPSLKGTGMSTQTIIPQITASTSNADLSFLIKRDHKESFKSDDACWIQYAFNEPFTCRTITIRTSGNSYQAHRLLVQASDDGENFTTIERLDPPRHGWQDSDADVTHSIQPVTAKYFRFVYRKEGSGPGAEDLDAAKWKPSLKLRSIELSAEPRIHQFEGKSGRVWRISKRTPTDKISDDICVRKDKIIDLTKNMDATGRLTWNVPPGNWTILQIGHTSTGHTNYTGGGGLGLECDKFNKEAVKLQFDSWFGEIVNQAGPDLAARVLEIFHIDSWECGSQNWSTVFREEFQQRRGYDLLMYLPVLAGIPVESAAISERFLYDVRQTIAELIHDNFYGTMASLAHEKGAIFTAESVAPTMTSDGMLHYDLVDVPMGEFWFQSPTHDKPNDMMDAISGAHVYGKAIIQAEAFTTLRMNWSEHPGMLKTTGDRNFALGVNRLVYHVFTHNPWLDRKPGMTLDGVGLYFQRDQTWWKPGRAWIEYVTRCQALLQQGHPVVDVAVFTGEEIPRRAILPDRLVPFLPGIFGNEVVNRENERLANKGEPLREIPDGVRHSANMADPHDWIDPLHGYAFDSFNKDALLRLATVNNGRIELPGGASYGLLIIPGSHAMSPHADLMSPEVARRLHELVVDGATVVINETPVAAPGLKDFPHNDEEVKNRMAELTHGIFEKHPSGLWVKQIGKGRVIKGPYDAPSFDMFGISRDFMFTDTTGDTTGIAWTHRKTANEEIYFISNQQAKARTINASLRASGYPQLYDPVTNEVSKMKYTVKNGRTSLLLTLHSNASLFILLKNDSSQSTTAKNLATIENSKPLSGQWKVQFDPAYGGPKKAIKFDALHDWSTHSDFGIKHYSGTVIYSQSFSWDRSNENDARVWLDLGEVANIAEVKLNGISCGIAWTPPYRVEVTNALKRGTNRLTIEVTNTWANRLIGDQLIPEEKRVTKTTAPYRLAGKPLLPAGLLGPVKIVGSKQ